MTETWDLVSKDDIQLWFRLFDPPSSETEESNFAAAPNRPPGPKFENVMLSVPAQIRNKSVQSLQMEFQMTILAREKLGPKKAAILLTVSTVEAIEGGCDVTRYLALQYLLEFNKICLRNPTVNKDAHKKAIALCEATLLAFGNQGWISLTDRMLLDQEKVKRLQTLSWYPTLRTYRSWAEFYRPERLLELRIVPLEQFQERSQNTLPYSGYTKGYHESGRGYRRDGMVYGEGKTPFDPEIDEDRTSQTTDLSSPIDEDPQFQSLTLAIQKAKERNRKAR